MFQGQYTNNMDDKGRVNIPSPFRDVLLKSYNEPVLIVARHPQYHCLRVYPLKEWRKMLAKLGERPSGDRIVAAFKRAVVSSAQEFTPDKQGRILVPQSLRDHANIVKGAVFAGQNETFEIWNEDSWKVQIQEDFALLQGQDLGF